MIFCRTLCGILWCKYTPNTWILLFASDHAKWSQYEEYTKPTPFRCFPSADSSCQGDPLLIGLSCPVASELVL
jgi:hypothetical protein